MTSTSLSLSGSARPARTENARPASGERASEPRVKPDRHVAGKVSGFNGPLLLAERVKARIYCLTPPGAVIRSLITPHLLPHLFHFTPCLSFFFPIHRSPGLRSPRGRRLHEAREGGRAGVTTRWGPSERGFNGGAAVSATEKSIQKDQTANASSFPSSSFIGGQSQIRGVALSSPSAAAPHTLHSPSASSCCED